MRNSTNGEQIFEMTPAGVGTVLHTLNQTTDGAVPGSGVWRSSDGNFYGVAEAGGTTTNCSSNLGACGVIFKITPAGTCAASPPACRIHSVCRRLCPALPRLFDRQLRTALRSRVAVGWVCGRNLYTGLSFGIDCDLRRRGLKLAERGKRLLGSQTTAQELEQMADDIQESFGRSTRRIQR